MVEDLVIWLFWLGAAAIGYSTLAASIRYVLHWRRGARIMAAQAALQTLLCTFGLATLWCIYRAYMSG